MRCKCDEIGDNGKCGLHGENSWWAKNQVKITTEIRGKMDKERSAIVFKQIRLAAKSMRFWAYWTARSKEEAFIKLSRGSLKISKKEFEHCLKLLEDTLQTRNK